MIDNVPMPRSSHTVQPDLCHPDASLFIYAMNYLFLWRERIIVSRVVMASVEKVGVSVMGCRVNG